MESRKITPEMARAELRRREQARQQTIVNMPGSNITEQTPKNETYEEALGRVRKNIPGVNFNPSFLEKLSPNILAGAANVGKTLLNLPHDLIKYRFGSKAGEYIPKMQDYDYSTMLKLPGTGSDQFVQGLTEVAGSPAMLLPSAKLGLAGKLISKIPKVGSYVEGAISRMIPQLGYAAATSEDPMSALKQSAQGQAIGELLPLGLKGIGKFAELLNPKQYAGNLGKVISEGYKSAIAKAEPFFQGVKNQFGNYQIYNILSNKARQGAPSYRQIPKDILDSFPKVVRKLHDDFIKNPTLNNAHKLEQQLGESASKYARGPNPADSDISYELNTARKKLSNDIKTFLGSADKKALTKWNEGKEIYKNEVIPYRQTKTIYDLANDTKAPLTPESALNALTKITSLKNGGIPSVPEGHQLRQLLKVMSRKYNRGKFLQDLIPGKGLLKQLPVLSSIPSIQNPYVIQKLQELSPNYEKLKNALVASQLPGNTNNQSR